MEILHFRTFILDSLRGQAALSLILLIGGIVVFVGITLSILALSFVNATYGFQAAQRAYGVALAGIEDALLQLARGSVGTSSGSTGRFTPSGNSYNMPIGSDSADVGIVWNGTYDQVTISATSSIVANHRRGLQVVASVNLSTGQVVPISWNFSNQ